MHAYAYIYAYICICTYIHTYSHRHRHTLAHLSRIGQVSSASSKTLPAPSDSDSTEGVFVKDGKFAAVVVHQLADQQVKLMKEFDSRQKAEKWLQAARDSQNQLAVACKKLNKEVEESSKYLENCDAVKATKDISDIQAGNMLRHWHTNLHTYIHTYIPACAITRTPQL